MPVYWLTPVESLDPLVLGAGRVAVPGDAEWQRFRERLALRFHPRLLPMVKAAILPSDPEEDGTGAACGWGEFPRLSEPGPVVFDGSRYGLSECGRAFMDRLPASAEQSAAWGKALAEGPEAWEPGERTWLALMFGWARAGHITMLVKEE